MKRWKIVSLILLIFVVVVYLNNSSYLTTERSKIPKLLAHRGMAQTFPLEGVANDTCTAERIYQPTHRYLENTLASMEAAFNHGADMVELDLAQTKDNQFAIFHDAMLDCRTNLKGKPQDYTMEELKHADIGYGYTADAGKTYPFRGKGIGLMPSLTEVLTTFSNKQLLLHFKTENPQEGELLATYLAKLPAKQQNFITVYGGDQPIASLKAKLPNIRVMSKATMKSCLLPYIAIGWTGYVPQACAKGQLHIPEKIARWLWGWPNKFLNRMDAVNTRVVVVGGNGSGFSSGFDTANDLKRLPKDYSGWIWTNRIEQIAPIYKK